MRVGQHGFDLRPLRGLEGLPIAVGLVVAVPRPGGIAEAGAVREQIADGDGIDGAVGIVDLAELGDVADCGIVERELAVIAQLEDGDGGECLGDGCPVVGGLRAYGLMGVAVRFAKGELGGVAAMDDGEAAADYAVAGELVDEARMEIVQLLGAGGVEEKEGTGQQRHGRDGIEERGHGDHHKRGEGGFRLPRVYSTPSTFTMTRLRR